MIPWCHALSNAFYISRKTLLTLSPRSKDSYISWVIDISWLMQESPCFKPACFDKIIISSIKKLKMSLNINLSRIFPQIDINDTARSFSSFVCPLFFEWEQYLPFTIQKQKHQFHYVAWISFPEVCRWKNHIFLTCKCWCYHDHELDFDLSFELF